MNTSRREVFLEMASRSIERSREYSEKYVGAGIFFRLKRFFRYPINYSLFVVARALRLPVSRRARLFFGGFLHVSAADGDGFLLSTFGTLVGEEYKLIRYLIRNLREDEIFYDIGANYGFYTSLAHRLLPRGEIHAFEPVPGIFYFTNKSLGGEKNISLNNLALSDFSGETEIFSAFASGVSAISTLRQEVKSSQQDICWDAIRVSVQTLDSYVRDHKAPTIIKIDVEGAETSVLSGALSTITSHNPIIIMEVWGGERGMEFSLPSLNILFSLGYTAFEIRDTGEICEIHEDPISLIQEVVGFDNFIFKKLV